MVLYNEITSNQKKKRPCYVWFRDSESEITSQLHFSKRDSGGAAVKPEQVHIAL